MTTARTAGTREGTDTVATGRVIRVNVSPADWRTLRVRAAERDEPMSDLVGALLAREAQKIRRS